MKNKEENKPVATDFRCPACKQSLYRQWGDQMHPGDKEFGVVLYCAQGDPEARKHPQEVSGHGNGRSEDTMIKNAWAVIQAKFCGAQLEMESTEEPEANEPKATPAPVVETPKKAARKSRQSPPVVEPDDEDAI